MRRMFAAKETEANWRFPVQDHKDRIFTEPVFVFTEAELQKLALKIWDKAHGAGHDALMWHHGRGTKTETPDRDLTFSDYWGELKRRIG